MSRNTGLNYQNQLLANSQAHSQQTFSNSKNSQSTQKQQLNFLDESKQRSSVGPHMIPQNANVPHQSNLKVGQSRNGGTNLKTANTATNFFQSAAKQQQMNLTSYEQGFGGRSSKLLQQTNGSVGRQRGLAINEFSNKTSLQQNSRNAAIGVNLKAQQMGTQGLYLNVAQQQMLANKQLVTQSN